MIGTLASRVTGLLRQSLLNQLFSVEVTDAFLIAQKIPNLFRELLAEGALINSFVPAYKALPPAEAKRLSGALLSLLVVLNGLLLLLAVLGGSGHRQSARLRPGQDQRAANDHPDAGRFFRF